MISREKGMKETDEACFNCKFYDRDIGIITSWKPHGKCKVAPPQLKTIVELGFTTKHKYEFPTVKETDFCGQFKPKRGE